MPFLIVEGPELFTFTSRVISLPRLLTPFPSSVALYSEGGGVSTIIIWREMFVRCKSSHFSKAEQLKTGINMASAKIDKNAHRKLHTLLYIHVRTS